eukprot:CAMPEP_0197662508 /NCGR_PEP_ID=MMETSP1338-20131121/53699_1 /TAXON_ID=43686 ORGANISM="Pelagodinium beii, Strain RCC1491" /NCGR_SAMPLE_ID=MMETSP1338 /ASSEMBLY_ACC=CAM_ASM_000754 /LENGTH=38 /DNA_ID= /DNA_START= /DNA_END= /DNA_ORIENTATION=
MKCPQNPLYGLGYGTEALLAMARKSDGTPAPCDDVECK